MEYTITITTQDLAIVNELMKTYPATMRSKTVKSKQPQLLVQQPIHAVYKYLTHLVRNETTNIDRVMFKQIDEIYKDYCDWSDTTSINKSDFKHMLMSVGFVYTRKRISGAQLRGFEFTIDNIKNAIEQKFKMNIE